jgi:hypothetical protein
VRSSKAESNRRWMRRARWQLRLHIDAIKRAGECRDCGLRPDDLRELDFDHIRGEKRFDIGRALSRTVSRVVVDREMTKCELVCRPCHRVRHATRLPGAITEDVGQLLMEMPDPSEPLVSVARPAPWPRATVLPSRPPPCQTSIWSETWLDARGHSRNDRKRRVKRRQGTAGHACTRA